MAGWSLWLHYTSASRDVTSC